MTWYILVFGRFYLFYNPKWKVIRWTKSVNVFYREFTIDYHAVTRDTHTINVPHIAVWDFNFHSIHFIHQ